MIRRLLTLLCISQFAWAVMGQTQAPENPEVPSVGLIGEYEAAFAQLAEQNPGILLGVCGNDMDIAYEKWTDMQVAMEDYAASIDFDLDGFKTYFYIFWNADGSIEHLAFYPKANSRNIPVEDLRTFLQGFVAEYRMTILSDVGYSHYGSASFPPVGRIEYKVRKD